METDLNASLELQYRETIEISIKYLGADLEGLFFFRPTPGGSRQVVYQAGKTTAFCKFTELMQ